MDVIVTFLLGLLLRLGVPIAITALVFAILHRLDQRWQKEAMALPVIPIGKRCWEIEACSEEKKKDCPAAAQADKPCWQVFRNKDGSMKETCLVCEVFRKAPVPIRA